MARGRPSRIDIAKPDIVKLFESSAQNIYWPAELASIVAQDRSDWRLTQATNARNFIEYLLARTRLKEVRLSAENYPQTKQIVRYVWGTASAYALALSLRRNAYLCHGTAVYLHSLTDQLPKTIYVNSEQSEKPRGSSLTQEASSGRLLESSDSRTSLFDTTIRSSCSSTASTLVALKSAQWS